MIEKCAHFLAGVAVIIAGINTSAQASKEPPRLFGASLGNHWPGNAATDVKFFTLMKEAGVTHTGLGINWDNIEKERGKYNWAPWDYAIEMAGRFDLEIQGVIVGCPEWALPKSGDLGWLPVALNMPREDCVQDFKNFVTALAKRYAGKVERFAFWNEPNGYNKGAR
jgi:GH35 family endo-1,4-beta-xylanase